MSEEKEILMGGKLGWSQTFYLGGRYPLEANKIFSTLSAAKKYVISDATAYAGNVISVIYDDNVENNGVYFVKSVGANGELVKVGSDSNVDYIVDWQAREGEEGYIKNKPFAFGTADAYDVKEVEVVPTHEDGSEVNVTLLEWVYDEEGDFGYWNGYDWLGGDPYLRISIPDMETIITKPSELRRGEDESGLYIDSMSGNIQYNDYFQSKTTIKVELTYIIIPLHEYFIPETIARKSELTELSAEVSGLSERIDNLPTAESSVSDWYAQDYESGYIKNKPFGLEYCISEDIIVENPREGFEKEILRYSEEDGYWGYYDDLGDKPFLVLSHNGVIIGEIQLEPNTNKRGSVGGNFYLKLEDNVLYVVCGWTDSESETFKYYIGEPKQLNEVFIPDTVLKTTPQELSDDDKNQVLDNLGIANLPFSGGESENSAVLKGGNNKVTNANEVALGKYNESNNDTMFSIGIGTSDTDRKNAFEVKGNGDIYFNDIKFELTPDTDDEVESVWNNILL